MINFLACQDKTAVQKLFLVHGEYETQKKYMASLNENGFGRVEIPAKGQEYEI
jgi:metallo-beta-lactamase family protein